MPHPLRQQILNVLWPEGMPSRVGVYAVLDGARDERIFGAILGSRTENCCLFAGDLPGDLEVVAPYLLNLNKESEFTNWLIDEGWGKSWGIFLRSDAGFKKVRNHLRTFLRVRYQDKWSLFRYYDPRVLSIYLPACGPLEVKTLLGPLFDFIVEDEEGRDLLRFISDRGEIQTSSITVGKQLLSNWPGQASREDFSCKCIGRLRITDHAAKMLQHSLNGRFGRRLMPEIRQQFPSKTIGLSDPSLLELLQRGIERAQRYELQTDRDVAAFVEMTFVAGEKFDEYPRFRSILTDPTLLPDERMEVLLDAATDEDWETALMVSADDSGDPAGRNRTI